ncbi:MAG: UDP-N-acetylmuramate dehydrogenase [Rikenellaceae bacterium]|nr:UDP-N-acetylmuramate dehydrogenase [Rikenellaceae bacterium]
MIRHFTEHPLAEMNSFHVREHSAHIIEFDQPSDLDTIFTEGKAPDKWFVLGGGNNILFTTRYDGVLIHPVGKNLTIIAEDEQTLSLKADAGIEWDDMVAWCVERGLWGAENLSLIPGTIGASPVQNIGAYGAEAKDIITRVNYFNTAERKHLTLSKEECHFGYRESIFKHDLRGKAIITSVEFTLHKEARPNLGYGDLQREVEARGGATLANIRDAVCAIRRSKLPDTTEIGNAGSFFKNPIVDVATAEELLSRYENMPTYPAADGCRKIAAGWLIDQAGMKGYRKGNVGVHDRQALVLVNFGGATGNEVIALAQEVQRAVYEKFGIRIEPEVNIL